MLRVSLVIRLLFALCLLVGTKNHLQVWFEHGLLWHYGFGPDTPLASRVFWDLLTVLDPLAALLLFSKPRWGVGLTLLIILVDVLHNSVYVAAAGLWSEPFYLAQVAFLLVVLGLAPVALRGLVRPCGVPAGNDRKNPDAL